MKKLVLVLLFITLSSCEHQETKFKVLEFQTYKNNVLNKNIQLFDVRTSEEYNLGHIEGSINIDFKNQEKFNEFFGNLDKKNQYIFTVDLEIGVKSQLTYFLNWDFLRFMI